MKTLGLKDNSRDQKVIFFGVVNGKDRETSGMRYINIVEVPYIAFLSQPSISYYHQLLLKY
jgi:hypothetical protein